MATAFTDYLKNRSNNTAVSTNLFQNKTSFQPTTTATPKFDTTQMNKFQLPATTPAPQVKPTTISTGALVNQPQKPKIDTAPETISSLQNTFNTTIPEAPSSTPASDKLDFATTRATTPKFQQDRETGLSSLLDLMQKQGTKATRQEELATETGLYDKQQQYTDALAEEAKIDREYENRLRRMREGAVGVSEGALQAQETELRRQRSQEKADLAIITAARQGDFKTAQDIVKQKLDAEFEPLTQQVETLKTFLTINQNDLSDSEKLKLQGQIDQQTKQIESQYDSALKSNQAQLTAQSINQGIGSIDKVSSDQYPLVLAELNALGYVDPKVKTEVNRTAETAKALYKLLNHPGKDESVGKVRIGLKTLFTGERSAFAADLQEVVSNLQLANVSLLKGTGPLTDQEQATLRKAASTLENIKQGEGFWDKEAISTAGKLVDMIVSSPAVDRDTKQGLLIDKFSAENPKATDEQVAEMVQRFMETIPSQPTTFNQVGNTTASLNRPQRNNNPGNVKIGGLADDLAVGTDEQGHLVFPDAQTGFMAMKRDVQAKINGQSRFLPANPTIAQLGKVYAEDPNWANSVSRILGVSPTTPTATLPIDQLVQAIAKQEGFYA